MAKRQQLIANLVSNLVAQEQSGHLEQSGHPGAIWSPIRSPEDLVVNLVVVDAFSFSKESDLCSLETLKFAKIVLSSASAMIREVASHAMNGFDVDGKIPLVKVIPLINKICQPDQHSRQGFPDFMSTALTFETITAFADSVFDTFSW